MEFESAKEIAIKHGLRVGELEKRYDRLLEMLRPEDPDNPANPLEIFKSLLEFRESTGRQVTFKSLSGIRIAQESVYAYTQAAYSMDTMRNIVNAASASKESTIGIPMAGFDASEGERQVLAYNIWRDVVKIFGLADGYEYFERQFWGGINAGKQHVLDSLSTKEIPLFQYNRQQMDIKVGSAGNYEAVELPTNIEGISVDYSYPGGRKLADITVMIEPLR